MLRYFAYYSVIIYIIFEAIKSFIFLVFYVFAGAVGRSGPPNTSRDTTLGIQAAHRGYRRRLTFPRLEPAVSGSHEGGTWRCKPMARSSF